MVAAALRICRRLNLVDETSFDGIDAKAAEVGRLVTGLIEALRENRNGTIRDEVESVWDYDGPEPEDMTWWLTLLSEQLTTNN